MTECTKTNFLLFLRSKLGFEKIFGFFLSFRYRYTIEIEQQLALRLHAWEDGYDEVLESKIQQRILYPTAKDQSCSLEIKAHTTFASTSIETKAVHEDWVSYLYDSVFLRNFQCLVPPALVPVAFSKIVWRSYSAFQVSCLTKWPSNLE